MKRALAPIMLATLAATGFAAAAAAAQDKAATGKLYCWNEGGQRVCSDRLPPEQAAGARTEISNKSGRTLDRVDRALTDEERAAQASEAEIAKRDAESEAARMRRELAMVESYATENDLMRAFNERIALVDAGIKTSQLSEANLRRGLVGLLQQASNLELAGKPVPKPLHEKVLARHAELGKQAQVLQQQLADRAALDVQLTETVARYRELKADAAQ